MISQGELEELRIKVDKATKLEDKLSMQCDLIEALLFHDLKEAETLSKEVVEKSESSHNERFKFKGNTLLLRIYRATQQTDLGIALVENLVNNIPKNTTPDNEFLVHNSLVNLYIEKFKNKDALAYAKKIEKFLYPKLSIRHKAHFHTDLGKLYDRLSYHDLSIEQYEKALDLFETSKDLNGKAKVLFSIGLLFLGQPRAEKAIYYFEETLKIDLAMNSNNPLILLQSYLLISRCQVILGQEKLANKSYSEAIRLAKESKNEAYINRVQSEGVYSKSIQERHKTVLELGLPLLEKDEFKKDGYFYFQTSRCIAIAYLNASKPKKAEALLLACADYYEANNLKDYLPEVYKFLSEVFEKQDDLKTALEYYKKHSELLVEIQKEKERLGTEQFQIKYETAQMEKEAEKSKTASLKFQLQSLRSQMNPHFVFNAISSISNDLKPETTTKAKGLLKSFARIMRSNLDFTERETIRLEEEIQFLEDYLNLEVNRLRGKLDFTIVCKESLDKEFVELPSMLIQPYVENAVKHGILPLKGKGDVKITFEDKGEFLVCTIQDNGIGRKQAAINAKNAEKHLGKSTAITATRLDLIAKSTKHKVLVKYEDLMDKTKNSTGTKVSINIKH